MYRAVERSLLSVMSKFLMYFGSPGQSDVGGGSLPSIAMHHQNHMYLDLFLDTFTEPAHQSILEGEGPSFAALHRLARGKQFRRGKR